jgi:hypothetical protein
VFTRQGFSLFRIGLIIGGIGILAAIAGGASFFLDQSSRQVPLDIESYPGALPAGRDDLRANQRRQFFRVVGVEPEPVVEYYQNKMQEFSGENRDCVRLPASGEFPTNREDVVPYEFRCHFDNSGFRSTQYTTVHIQPGVFNSDPARNTEGMTVIIYEQYWQPR